MSQPVKIPTQKQVSAGGVAFRRRGESGMDSDVEIALICVGAKLRWQLPKGLIDEGEVPEETAVREVREEAGIDTQVTAPINVIEYWYVGHQGGERVRFHKFVHIFLMEYRSGDVENHDHEVMEARWVTIEDALAMLAFPSERQCVEQAQRLIDERTDERPDTRHQNS